MTGRLHDVRQHERRDHFVVRRQLALGNSVVGKQNFFGMRDHHVSLTTSRGDLSMRTPSNRGWRSLPCTVHSMKATCTTISGRTQCARRRGSPLPCVNGVFGISSVSSRARRSRSSLRIETRADLAGEDEVVAIEIADEQRAQADAAALRIGESADDEFLRRLALHLQPVRRAAVLVGRVAAFRDHAFPSFAAGALPRLVVGRPAERVRAELGTVAS